MGAGGSPLSVIRMPLGGSFAADGVKVGHDDLSSPLVIGHFS